MRRFRLGRTLGGFLLYATLVGPVLLTVVLTGCILVERHWLNGAEAPLRELLDAGVGAPPIPVQQLVGAAGPSTWAAVCVRLPYGIELTGRGEAAMDAQAAWLDQANAHLRRVHRMAGESEWNLVYVGDAGVRVLSLDFHQVPVDYDGPVCVPHDTGQLEVVALTQHPLRFGITLGTRRAEPAQAPGQ